MSYPCVYHLCLEQKRKVEYVTKVGLLQTVLLLLLFESEVLIDTVILSMKRCDLSESSSIMSPLLQVKIANLLH